MGVEYKATLGYGLVLTKEDVLNADPDEYWWTEVVDNMVYGHFPLLTTNIGGGGYSDTDEVIGVFVTSTEVQLDDVDGFISLNKSKHVSLVAQDQLRLASVAITGSESAANLRGWYIVGGFF